MSDDIVVDAAKCVLDAGDCGWPSRSGRRHLERARSSEELDAAAERVRRREARIKEERERIPINDAKQEMSSQNPGLRTDPSGR